MFYEPDGEDLEMLVVGEGDFVVEGRGYQQLKIYQMAHALGVAAHRLSLRLPKYELYETGSQLRRSAKSVSANIVEGYGRRRYKAEFIRFLCYAKASLDETEEHLQYVRDCHPDEPETTALLEAANHLGRKLTTFLEAVAAHHRT